jgi:uncharacterized membrane protein (UPF0182 family)
VSGIFSEGRVFGRDPLPRRRPKALLPTLGIVIGLVVLIGVFTDVWTERLWYSALGYRSVYTTLLETRTMLFAVFGLALALSVAGNIALAYRFRSRSHPASAEQQSLDRYRDAVEPLKRWIVIGLAAILLLFGGSNAAGDWKTYLLWRNGGSFGVKDQFFGRDIGFYVFDYPFYRMVIGYLFAIVILSLLGVLATHYLYGGIRVQGRKHFSDAAQVHVSALLGVFMLLKAVSYWLDRYGLTISDGRLFTGVSYTDAHAVMPAKNILLIISLICASLFFANIVLRTWMLPAIGFGLLLLSAILIGGIYPAIVQQFQVKPSEPDKEGPYIAKNITATREAYGVANVQVSDYAAVTDIGPSQLRAYADSLPGTRLLDPMLVRQAFEQLQQVRGFYAVPDLLDVDRYQVGNNPQPSDMVVALREVDLNGLPIDQRNWNNDHTVYTHGNGMIAAYGNRRGPSGEPVWSEQDLPPIGQLGSYRPQVYFGDLEPNYSIVGAPPGQAPIELDIPDTESAGSATKTTTYDGGGGVPIGSTFHQLLYAMKYHEPNILLSGRVNADSQILYDRSPRERVEKIAPWLTVDGDQYPAIVDGHLVWIVDAYTTTGNYPQSERESLEQATSDSLTGTQALAAQSSTDINYVRNSVKAVVDAYDGSVSLYQWDPNDPILKAWMSAFPGVVKPQSEIPDALREHLRYPEDLFKVQREILARYHVTNASTFYQGTDRWRVPEDPTIEAGTIAQPPYYLSVKMPGQSEPAFSLTSVYVPNNRQNLAAFMSVDANAASSDYGTMRILQLPGTTTIPGPGQMANAFNADQTIARELQPYRLSGSRASFGNLLTLPVGGGLLYVQPVYTQRGVGEGTYPVLQLVLASFGGTVGSGTTLDQALAVVLGGNSGTTQPPPDGGGGGGGGGGSGTTSDQVRSLLQQANAKYEAAQAALANQDLATYALRIQEMDTLIQQALALTQPSGEPTSGPTGGSTPGDGGTTPPSGGG